MDFSYISIADTIVYQDSFTERIDNQNSLSFLNLDTLDSHRFGVPSEIEGIFNDIEAFKQLDIASWSGEDCLDWAIEVCRSQGIDQNIVNLAAFRQMTGSELMTFSVYDFCRFDTVYGPAFHEEFQRLLEKRGLASAGCTPETSDLFATEENTLFSEGDSDLCDLSPLEPDEDLTEIIQYIDHPASSWDSLMLESDRKGFCDSSYVIEQCSMIKTEETCSEFSDDGGLDIPCSSPEPPCLPEEDVLGKIRTKSRKRVRGPKNWEFMIRLLVDKKYNPELIRWEDQDEKTFRLVKPVIIAQMWGKRANKPRLSYDNFARGLRYQYTTGALKPVPERQLVYKCGPKALKFLKELQGKGY
ncbi:ETS homologous factor-like [Penaeus japonicus]|uniref:ETS homologous factor-like n=1 Tax=Penaeus japonicus TaxID=27405 RepID=UPI001C711379|nr:ETS homologous factor-like [Penaeus japonicus]